MYSYTRHLLVMILAVSSCAIATPSQAQTAPQSDTENSSNVVSISSESTTPQKARSLREETIDRDSSAIASDSLTTAQTPTRSKSPLFSRIFPTLQQ